ncbi:Hydroxyacylglutathione hydrolase 2, mitochondrial [Pseudocercospora fuligena]|uniref:Hydroxyacylglutathione hydrolase 2, mitochondrial n=1 Tax=Pseudocercospora fuligena TaxID=685502 RepID=A0A8H6VFQ6_9PEZI|nr:Hydroxyacylglutathione hydrolase 2, mitochondrial [Pseudocercospora fuligena]
MLSSLLLAATWAIDAIAQSARPTNFTALFNVTTYPDAQVANVSQYLNQAALLAGDDLDDHFQRRCITGQVYDDIADSAQMPGFIPPIEVFDGVYFVGQSAVSAWAIATEDGLVIIDALNNAEEAEQILIPGLQHFGYDGSDIAALIITHEHFDHYGGALWLQDTYNTTTFASELAWEAMEVAEGGPRRDQIVTDGQELTFGNFSIRFIATPGHTPGSTSLIFPVFDHGNKHLVGLNGGAGIARNATAKEDQIESYFKLASIAEEAGVDTLLANHQTQDRSLTNFELLKVRQCVPRGCLQDHPSVIGTEAFVRYLQVQSLCARVQAARSGQSLNV